MISGNRLLAYPRLKPGSSTATAGGFGEFLSEQMEAMNRIMMDYKIMEELLYTDLEIRQEAQEIHWRRAQVNRRRTCAVAESQQPETIRANAPDAGFAEDRCPQLTSPISWPVQAYKSSGAGVRSAWTSMEMGKLGLAG